MRAFALLTIASLSAISMAQKATFDAIQGGKNVGTLIYERKVAGSIQTTVVTINMTQNGQKVKILVTTKYNQVGFPSSKITEITAGAKSARIATVFTGMTAKVTATSDGKTQSRDLKAPGKASLNDPSVWWFVQKTPKVNESFSFQSFNPIDMTWSESKTTFVGKGQVEHRGKKITANQVRETRAGQNMSVWIDDKGIPVILDQGTMKFVRK